MLILKLTKCIYAKLMIMAKKFGNVAAGKKMRRN